jgi:hypothetical protein
MAEASGVAVAESMPPLCVDVPAAALALGVGVSAIRRWIESGELPMVKFPSEKHDGEKSRRVLIAVDDLRTFVNAHRVTEPAR